ncbi:Fanconi-associated nuclease 1 [Entophlyctis luteolus]|nr:Fanconi-associated nuclease 1 [Entophlyctis luteolus]
MSGHTEASGVQAPFFPTTSPASDVAVATTTLTDSLRAIKAVEFAAIDRGDSTKTSIDSPLSYVQQWMAVIDGVKQSDPHLIDSCDNLILAAFVSLNDAARYAFIRLMLRSHKIERLSRVSNFISPDDLKFLSDSCLVDLCPLENADISKLLDMLSKTELMDLGKLYRIRNTAKTSADLLAEAIKSAILSSRSIASAFSSSTQNIACENLSTSSIKRIKSIIGPCVYIPKHILDCFHRIFIVFNRAREWPENPFLPHILTNLKSTASRFHFADYKIVRVSLTWPTRQDLLDYMDILKLRHCVTEKLKTISGSVSLDVRNEIYASVLEQAFEKCMKIFSQWTHDCPVDGHISGVPWLSCFTAGKQAFGVLCTLATQVLGVSRMKAGIGKFDADFTAALFDSLITVNIIGTRRARGELYDAYMKFLVRLGRRDAAYRIGLTALGDPAVEFGRRREIESRMLRLGGKEGREPIVAVDSCLSSMKNIFTRTVVAEKIFSETGRKALYKLPEDCKDGEMLHYDEVGLEVEQLALVEFQRLGFRGVHAESSVVTTLFGLLFWDILFDDSVPGVFTSPFQDAPLDLNTEFFYIGRKTKVDARLADLAHSPETLHLEIISEVDSIHRDRETICRGVHWQLFSREDLLEVAQCFSGTQLAAICDGLIHSYGAHRGGVPDLCVWKNETKEVKLVEVKGEGDHLSHAQIKWIDLLATAGVCVELFRVQLPEATERKRKKTKSAP